MKDLVDLLGSEFGSDQIKNCLGRYENPDVFDDGIDLYYSYQNEGVTFIFNANRLKSIMFYSNGRDGFSQYRGHLPFGLEFHDSKATVEKKIGHAAPLFGKVPIPFPQRTESNWAKFPFDRWDFHVEFKSSSLNEISLITATMRNQTERLN